MVDNVGNEDISREKRVFFDNLAWMTSSEAAHYLRMTEGALRTAVYRGQIRARKWRRRLYFRKLDIDLLLEGSFLTKGGT
jgi:hypothetical protein